MTLWSGCGYMLFGGFVMSEMRTPLSRVRGSGSAKKGTEHFWLQRVTALANIPLTLFLVGSLVVHAGSDHATMAGVSWQSGYRCAYVVDFFEHMLSYAPRPAGRDRGLYSWGSNKAGGAGCQSIFSP